MTSGSRKVFWVIAAAMFGLVAIFVHQSQKPPTLLLMTLLLGAFTAFAGFNLWQGYTQGQIMDRGGMVSREVAPFWFWLATAFWSVSGLFFLIMFLTFLDPRDFRPVLRVLDCDLKPWWSCLPRAFHG